MEQEIESFISYLHNVKKASFNTEMSYRRDLTKMRIYLEITSGSPAVHEITEENLKRYMAYMQRKKLKESTISRNVASMKAFFHYLVRSGMIQKDVSDCLQAPRVTRNAPDVLTEEETESLLNGPSGDSDKEIRDLAMLRLLYSTGIRVSELIGLKLADVNMQMGFLICREENKERMIPFDNQTREALYRYLSTVRDRMATNKAGDILFVSCLGAPMSRQGFWKIIKYYTKKVGIAKDITPHTLRHTFAAHLVESGADLKNVQELLGHSDISTTHIYANMDKKREIQEGTEE